LFARRHLLTQGAAALALAPSLARAATGTLIKPDTLPPPSLPDGELIQGMPDLQDRLLLETTIDGKGPFNFVVDTGADRSVIAYDLAARLGLLGGEDVIVEGIARSLSAATVELKNVGFGRITVDSLSVPVLPREWLGADGYLGLDVIDGRRVTFDFQNQRLSVTAPGLGTSGWIHPNEAIVRADGSHGRLTAVDCSVDAIPAFAFIDSGAQFSIGNTCLFNELRDGAGATYIKDEVVPVIGVTGGQTPGRLASISRVKLGTLNFDHCTLVIADLNVFNVWGLGNRPALFFGMNFLKTMSAFSIDYARKELHFKLAELKIASRGVPA
jgi:predicted aspartyl protease